MEYAECLLNSEDEKTNKEGFSVITDLVSKGNARAEYLLGTFYLEGRFVKRDEEKAQKILTRSANKGYKESRYKLNELYQTKGIEPTESHERIRYLKTKAENGDYDSMIALANCYLERDGVQTDKKQAEKLLQKAAGSGDEKAMSILGRCYETGAFGRPDREEAIKWYTAGAKKGNKQCKTALARVYDRENGTSEDKEKAIKIYKELAEEGDAQAQYKLALMEGDKELLMKAADNGNVESHFIYGQALYAGNGVQKDVDMAIHYFQKAAERDHIGSCKTLAIIYLSDQSNHRDLSKGKTYLKRAAELGDAESMWNYANILEEEIHDMSKCLEPFEWYKRAATLKHADAGCKVAEYYLCGFGGKNQDPLEAARWYRSALSYTKGGFNPSTEYERMVNEGLKASLKLEDFINQKGRDSRFFVSFAAELTETIKQKVKIAEKVVTETYMYSINEYEVSRTPIYKEIEVTNTYIGEKTMNQPIGQIIPFAI